MSIKEKLLNIQNELKAPKSQYNSFGKYKYRSCEDILEAVKPLCVKYGAVLTVSDEVVMVGERFYIKASATLQDTAENGCVCNTAWAREDDSKKGMDGSQITGTASSYARKYCLNGLFLIDDTKDADTDEHHNEVSKPQNTKAPKQEVPDKNDSKPLISKDQQGNTIILAQGNYYQLSAFNLEQLNKMMNSEKYADIHDEVRMLMAYKSKRQ